MPNATAKLFAAGLLLVLPASAVDSNLPASAQAAAKIRVCVNYNNYAAASAMTRARITTSRMFAPAGVALEWYSVGNAACRGSQQTQTIMLDFSTDTPPSQDPGALAYALAYEGVHIVVMFDRIKMRGGGPAQISTLLAHVVTHEIAHLLQGISRHTATGVMKAHWDAKDVVNMAHAPLPFAPEDIDLIQRGLGRRAAGSASAVPPVATPGQH